MIGANYTHIVGADSTDVSARKGILAYININTPVNGATITINNGSDTIGVITLPVDASAMAPVTIHYEIQYDPGLTIVTTGGGLDITVVWR